MSAVVTGSLSKSVAPRERESMMLQHEAGGAVTTEATMAVEDGTAEAGIGAAMATGHSDL